VYVRPTINGKVTTLGVSGKLWRDALIMFDRESYSLWSQVLGEAVAGEANGTKLQEIPAVQSTWGAWKKLHPDTLVLTKPLLRGSPYADYFRNPRTIGVVGHHNPDERLGPKVLVYGSVSEKSRFAIPLAVLKKHPVSNIETPDGPVLLLASENDLGVFGYSRRLGKRSLKMRLKKGKIRDEATNSAWDRETGRCLSGRLKGKQLTPIQGVVVYWGVFARYHKTTALLGVPKKAAENKGSGSKK